MTTMFHLKPSLLSLFLALNCVRPTCSQNTNDGYIAKHCKFESGRESKLAKVTVPLIAGFKLTGLLISAFTAIKIFLLQSLFISKLAFIFSFILVAKVVIDSMKKSSFSDPDTNILDYFPYGNPLMDFNEVPAVEMDYSNYQTHGQENLQTLHSNNFLSIAEPSLNMTGIVNRRGHEELQTTMPLVIGYKTYLKRIIKEVSN